MAEVVEAGLEAARAELQREQLRWGVMPAIHGEEGTQAALDWIDKRASAQVADGQVVWDGVFKYDAASESDRWDATRAIIRRTAPGPSEDPNYLALIAHQAASVEWFVREIVGGAAQEFLDRIVIGTTGAPTSEGFTRGVDGGALIAMSAGMIDLLYQTSKAIVLSWKPKPRAEGGGVAFSSLREDTIGVLNTDPYPVHLLRDTLATWFYGGFPRAAIATTPPAEYQPPLMLLIDGAERFIVAHEYGHALMDVLGVVGPDGTRHKAEVLADRRDRELRADLFATQAVAETCGRLDRLPPNFALQGAIVAMKAHQLFIRGLGIATDGSPLEDTASETHPSFERRLEQLNAWYIQSQSDPKEAKKQIGALRVPADTAELLWQRVEPDLRAEFKSGRKMAATWRQQ